MAKRTNAERRIQQQLANLTVMDIREALRKLFDALPEGDLKALRDKSIIALIALHGLQRVEIVRLNLSDLIDDPDGVLALRVAVNGGKFRVVKLVAETTGLLRRYLSALNRAKIEPKEDALGVPLFVSLGKGNGKRLTLTGLDNIVNEAIRKAGIKRKGISCRSLHHLFRILAAAMMTLNIDLAAHLSRQDIATTTTYTKRQR